MKKNPIIHRENDLEAGRTADEFSGAMDTIINLSRRRFLSGGLHALGGLVLASMAGGLMGKALGGEKKKAVETGKFIFPRLRFTVNDNTPDQWNVHPVGDVNLRRKLQDLTNINVSQEPRVVTLGDFDEMVRNPFIFMTSEGYFTLTETEESNLREFLERGGFIHADDCVYAGREDRFFRTYNKLMDKLFPDNPMRRIPDDHDIFHIYFDMKKGCPHMQGVPNGAYGLFERGTGRIMTVNTPGDLHCGWVNRWFNKEKNLEAMKMGINIIIYFLSH
ncbi:MAG: DUF4159 domain-containing protein [Planctomycetes bacterium]|nr:DUF4159 domain-containing protein [Planctomycetota bacterium]